MKNLIIFIWTFGLGLSGCFSDNSNTSAAVLDAEEAAIEPPTCDSGEKPYWLPKLKKYVCSIDPNNEKVDSKFWDKYGGGNELEYVAQLTINQIVLDYVVKLAGAQKLAENATATNTKCYGNSNHDGEGICWDLAACAVMRAIGQPTWSGGGNSISVGHGSDGSVKDPLYTWGELIQTGAYWDNLILRGTNEGYKENPEHSFVKAGVLPGDVVQYENFHLYCGSRHHAGAAGHHTAVVKEVHDTYLKVCQQNFAGNRDDVCGWNMFHCYAGSKNQPCLRYDNDGPPPYVHIYRVKEVAAASSTGHCNDCKIVGVPCETDAQCVPGICDVTKKICVENSSE